MKTRIILALIAALPSLVEAAPPPPTKPMAPPPPPPVYVAQPQTDLVPTTQIVMTTNVIVITNTVVVTNAVLVTNMVPTTKFVYEQAPLAGRPVLVSPEQAQAIIDRFRAGLEKLECPRILVYVNRQLVDEQSGAALSRRTEQTRRAQGSVSAQFKPDPAAQQTANAPQGKVNISAGGNLTVAGNLNTGGDQAVPGTAQLNYETETVTGQNTFRTTAPKELPLADRQTVRDVERLFGRPLRIGGASLVDQRVATQLIGNRPLNEIMSSGEGEQARKDREALAKIADGVLEILISSRNIVVTEVSGDKVYSVPDIQATVIRLIDSKIIGQATASDLIGKDRYASRIVRNFDVRDIAEATALSLMEDMMITTGE